MGAADGKYHMHMARTGHSSPFPMKTSQVGMRKPPPPKSPMEEQIPSFPGDPFVIASALSFIARRSRHP